MTAEMVPHVAKTRSTCFLLLGTLAALCPLAPTFGQPRDAQSQSVSSAEWSAQGNGKRTSQSQARKVKRSIPDPALINAQDYQDLLARYGGKPLLVNFWATWCEPCRDEYPMLNELARKYAGQGLVVLGVSFDDDA